MRPSLSLFSTILLIHWASAEEIGNNLNVDFQEPFNTPKFYTLTFISILLALADTLLAAVESIAGRAESAQIATGLLLGFEVGASLVHYGGRFHRGKLY